MPKFVAKYQNGYVIQEKLFPNGKENVFDFKCTCRTIKISFKWYQSQYKAPQNNFAIKNSSI